MKAMVSWFDLWMVQPNNSNGHNVLFIPFAQFNGAVNQVGKLVDAHLDANLNNADCCDTTPEDAEVVGPGGDAERGTS